MKNGYGHRSVASLGRLFGLQLGSLFESLRGFSFSISVAFVIGVLTTGCGAGAGSQSGGTIGGAPAGAVYSLNPAIYPYGSAIATNQLNYTGVADSLSISPALPAGLSFNTSNGSISGTPTTITPQQTYQVKVANGYGASYVSLVLAITDVPPVISYGGSTTLTFAVGTAIGTITPTLSGGATVSCNSQPPLPAGLTLSSACVISGTPTAASPQTTYVISAVNGGGSASLSFAFTVVDLAPVLTYSPTTYSFYINQAITAILPTNSGGSVISCASSPALPAGLTLSNTCGISGTPTSVVASAPYVITGTNSGGTSSQTLTLAVIQPAPTIVYVPSSATLTVGTAMTPLNVVNTGGAITSCTASPALPAGLSINSTTCAITGTPTAIMASALYAVTATNATGSSTTSVTLKVNDQAPSIIYTGSPFIFFKNQLITTLTPTNTGGGIVSCSANPVLPGGLSISTNCVISGTPTGIAAATNYVITAVNTGGSSNATINITVNDIAPNLAFAGSPFTFVKGVSVGTITPSNTGNASVSCTSTPSLPIGLSLSPTCVITGTPTAVTTATNYVIVGTNTAGSSTVIINIAVNDVLPVISYSGSPFVYNVNSAITTLTPTSTGGGIVSCAAAPTLPAGLSLSATCVITGTPVVSSVATNYIITAQNSAGTGSASISIQVNDVVPVINYTNNPFIFTNGVVITPQTPINTGGTITSCSSSPSLPSGLILSGACVISGTPTTITPLAVYTVTATNAQGSGATNVTITVNDVAPAINYLPTSYNFTYTNGTAITPLTPNNTGGAITGCTATPTLPAGLSIAAANCSITGTPTVVVAPTSYTIAATNSGGSSTAVITISINDAPPTISYIGTPFAWVLGTAITPQTPITSGGTIVSCSSSPGLPAGVALSSSCVISGTPLVAEPSTNYTITATNTGGNAAAAITITITSNLPFITYTAAPFAFTKGTLIATQTPTNAGAAITGCSSSPALPAGLSLAATTCAISGTPTVLSAAANYTITATGASGSSTDLVNIAVNDVAPNLTFAGSPYTFTKGTAITAVTPANTGGTVITCTSSPTLPAGLNLSSTCGITGTPTAVASTAAYTITGTNSGGTSVKSITITVNDVLPVLTYAGSPYTWSNGSSIGIITPTNTGGSVTSCTTIPALPAGITLSSGCVLTGTPTTPQSAANYNINATNSAGTATVTINITVNNILPAITYSGSPYTFTKGTAITTQTPTNTGAAITSCNSAPALPAGLTLAATTCALSGTPTVIATAATYTITATNASGSGTATISITVNDVAPNLAYAGSPFTFAKGTAITAVTPTNTGGTVVSCVSSPTLPTGLALSATCGISGTPTAVVTANNYTITATNTGGSNSVTISIAVTDTLPILAYAGSPYTWTRGTAITAVNPTNTGGAVISCSSSPTLPPGIALSATCGMSGTPTAAQTATSYTIIATNSAGTSTATINITVNNNVPAIAYVGSPYTFTKGALIATQTPTNTGAAITSCASAPPLPAGLSLAATTCAISGTPTAISATTSYTITATNAAGSGTATIAITVNDAIPNLAFAGSPFTYTKGTAITAVTPTNTGGIVVSCTSSPTLPAGLTLSATCGITGTPTVVASTASYTITATNTGGADSVTITVTVNDLLPVLTFAGSPYTWTRGTAIAATNPTNTGGTVISCTSTPSMPAGISLSATCGMTGTPTVAQTATTYTINATNSAGTATNTISITVNNNVPAITYAGSPYVYTKGTLITTVTPTNTGAAITSCASAPALPAGLSLAATTCALSGTPTVVAATTTYTITATNAAGSGSTTISITVNDVAPNLTFAGSPYTFTKGTAITAVTPTNTGGAVVSCASVPTLPAGLVLSATCGITGTPTVVSGVTAYTITGTNTGGTSVKSINITVKDTAPILAYAGSPFTWTKGTSIGTITPTNTGGTVVSCSSSPSLPAGISLSATCVLTGTPTVISGATTYTITATNTGGTNSPSIQVTVKDIAPTLAYAGSPFTYVVGTAITTLNPTNTGGPIVSCASVPTLPTGLSLSATCVLTGTPTVVAAAANYTITATNSGGTASAVINIKVNAVAPAITYSPSTYTFTQNVAITAVTPTNTGGAITGCTSAPALPAGLALAATTCVISGTPTAIVGTTSYLITATNTGGSSAAAVTITVNSLAPSIVATTPTNVEVLRTAITAITFTNSGGPITGCTSSPGLPAGLSIAATTCTITGTPTVVSGSTSYTITATNTGGSSPATITIQVKNQRMIAYYGKAAVNGTTNGTAAGSNNVWTSTQDGLTLTAITKNTNASLDSSYPAFSVDGANLTFVSLQALSGVTNGASSLSYNAWDAASTGGSFVDLTGNSIAGLDSLTEPVYSPDGTKVAFASKTALSGSANGTASGSYNIWIINATGFGITSLTTNTNAGLDSVQPVWDPSGTVLYFASLADVTGVVNGTASASYNIWKVNSNGTGLTALTNNTAAGLSSWQPAVSPDGTTIAFSSLAKVSGVTTSSYNIWKIGTNGLGLTDLTTNTAAGLDSITPSWSADNTEIVFASKMKVTGVTANSYNIWSMSATGASQTALTTNTAANLDSVTPAFSPDDVKIAFSSLMKIGATTANSHNIWTMNANGTAQTYVTGNTNAGLDSYLGNPAGVWYDP